MLGSLECDRVGEIGQSTSSLWLFWAAVPRRGGSQPAAGGETGKQYIPSVGLMLSVSKGFAPCWEVFLCVSVEANLNQGVPIFRGSLDSVQH